MVGGDVLRERIEGSAEKEGKGKTPFLFTSHGVYHCGMCLNRQVPIKALEFAIRQCERYIRFRENEDLNVVEERKVLQEEWNTFLQWFYIITNEHGRLQETSNAQLTVFSSPF